VGHGPAAGRSTPRTATPGAAPRRPRLRGLDADIGLTAVHGHSRGPLRRDRRRGTALAGPRLDATSTTTPSRAAACRSGSRRSDARGPDGSAARRASGRALRQLRRATTTSSCSARNDPHEYARYASPVTRPQAETFVIVPATTNRSRCRSPARCPVVSIVVPVPTSTFGKTRPCPAHRRPSPLLTYRSRPKRSCHARPSEGDRALGPVHVDEHVAPCSSRTRPRSAGERRWRAVVNERPL